MFSKVRDGCVFLSMKFFFSLRALKRSGLTSAINKPDSLTVEIKCRSGLSTPFKFQHSRRKSVTNVKQEEIKC